MPMSLLPKGTQISKVTSNFAFISSFLPTQACLYFWRTFPLVEHILLTRGCDATKDQDFNWDVRQVLMTRWPRLPVRTLSSGQDIPPACLFPSLRKPQGTCGLQLFNFLAPTFTHFYFPELLCFFLGGRKIWGLRPWTWSCESWLVDLQS